MEDHEDKPEDHEDHEDKPEDDYKEDHEDHEDKPEDYEDKPEEDDGDMYDDEEKPEADKCMLYCMEGFMVEGNSKAKCEKNKKGVWGFNKESGVCVECGDDCPEVEMPEMEKPVDDEEKPMCEEGEDCEDMEGEKPMCDDEDEECEEKPEKPM